MLNPGERRDGAIRVAYTTVANDAPICDTNLALFLPIG